MSLEINVTDQIVEINEVSNPVEINAIAGAYIAPVWGNITGTLSNQTDLQNSLNLKVPYTGATTNVNLGEFELKAGQMTLDTTPTGTAAVGTTRWNDAIGSSETTLKGGNVILKNGVDLVARVVNKVTPNTTLTKASYQAVRISGAQGQRLAIELAQANNDNNSADTIGLVTETIAPNQEGFIMTVGQLEGINTTGSLQGETWVDGDVLYLSPTVAGVITNVKPVAPQHLVIIGYVEYAHAVNGKIYVKTTNGFELGELHDVNTAGATNGQVLKYNGTIWTPSTDVGITGSGANGRVAYWNGANTQTSSPAFNWSASEGSLILGVGTYVEPSGYTNIGIIGSTLGSLVRFMNGGTVLGQILGLNSTNTLFVGTRANGNLFFTTNDITRGGFFANGRFFVDSSGATVDNGAAMQITGTATISSSLTANSLIKSGGTSTQYLMADGSVSTLTNPVTGTGAAGQVSYWSGTSTQAGSNNLFWDNTNGRLGIGTNAPAAALTINSAATLATGIRFDNAGSVGSIFGDGASMHIRSGATHGIQINTGSASLQQSIGSTGGFRIDLQTLTNAPIYSYLTDADTGIGRAAADTLTFYAGGEKARIFSTGNLLLQNGGTFTDSGQRLQVTGDTLLKGSGNTSATTALLVENSDGTDILQVRNDGAVFIGSIAATQRPYLAGYTNLTEFGASQRTLGIVTQFIAGNRPDPAIVIKNSANLDYTSGAGNFLSLLTNYSPTSGTGVLNNYVIQTTINQTGGANGITRGLYVNPTLTAAADWRSIEWSNNTGWGLYGAGTANNFLAGSLGIGATTNLTSRNLSILKNITGSGTSYAVVQEGVVQSDVTGNATGYYNGISTQNATFTLVNYMHFDAQQGAIGASSTITNQFGFRAASSLTTGTNIFGFRGDIAAATGRWNLYMNGTALNYMNGALLLGTTTSSTYPLTIYNATNSFIALNTPAAGITFAGIRLQASGLDRYTIAIQGTQGNLIFSRFNSSGVYQDDTMRLINSTGNVVINNTTDTGEKLQVTGTAKITGNVEIGGNLTLLDADNIIVGTTTGTKIGTATSQKIGFWNATPIVQPTTAVASATRVGGGGTTLTDTDTFDGYTMAQIVKALRNAGLLA